MKQNKKIENRQDVFFTTKLAAFATRVLATHSVIFDSGVSTVLDGIKGLLNAATKGSIRKDSENEEGLIFNQLVFIGDPVNTDGGLQWVTVNVNTNPITKKDYDTGVYQDAALVVPIGPNANPYADDLVKDYWGVPGGPREIIRKKLLAS